MRGKKVLNLETLKGKLFSSEAVAELLDLTPASIRRRIRNGQIPARVIPGQQGYTIDGDQLVSYLQGVPYTPGKPAKPPRIKAKAEPTLNPDNLPNALPKEANIRFKAWFSRQGCQIKDISERTGLGSDKISRILNLKRSITLKTLEALKQAYGEGLVNYLITGQGNP